jgi:hypothetical protein
MVLSFNFTNKLIWESVKQCGALRSEIRRDMLLETPARMPPARAPVLFAHASCRSSWRRAVHGEHGSTVIATSLPAIAADIGTNPLALKLAITAIAVAGGIPAGGWTADRFGARRVFAPPSWCS